MEPQELSQLVESSEAKAYASLIRAAPPPFLRENGFDAISLDSATAIVARSVTNTLNMNRVIGLGVAEPSSEAAVERIFEIYTGHGLSFGIEVGPFARPKALADWLRARRMRRGAPTAMHYREVHATEARRGPLSVVRAPASARKVVADICCSVFRMPAAAHSLIAGTADVPEWRQWLAYLDDRPVAAALSFVRDEIAWFGWDATLPECRGLGAQSSLIAHRLNDAAAAGARFVTTETATNTPANADPSYRNYQRLGFSFVYERSTYVALHRAAASVRAQA